MATPEKDIDDGGSFESGVEKRYTDYPLVGNKPCFECRIIPQGCNVYSTYND